MIPELCKSQIVIFVSTVFVFLLDFGIDVLSTNGSQEPHGPGLLKVSGLERSQERSQESCRDHQPSASITLTGPPQTRALSQQQLLSSVPPAASPQAQSKASPQALASTHLTTRPDALPRPQTPASLFLVHGKGPSPPPPPHPQNQPDRYSEASGRPINHPRPPQPLPSSHHPHQQHPSQAGPQRPPSRCQVRPLPACNNFKGHR